MRPQATTYALSYLLHTTHARPLLPLCYSAPCRRSPKQVRSMRRCTPLHAPPTSVKPLDFKYITSKQLLKGTASPKESFFILFQKKQEMTRRVRPRQRGASWEPFIAYEKRSKLSNKREAGEAPSPSLSSNHVLHILECRHIETHFLKKKKLQKREL